MLPKLLVKSMVISSCRLETEGDGKSNGGGDGNSDGNGKGDGDGMVMAKVMSMVTFIVMVGVTARVPRLGAPPPPPPHSRLQGLVCAGRQLQAPPIPHRYRP
jgi:hypothetical protein